MPNIRESNAEDWEGADKRTEVAEWEDALEASDAFARIAGRLKGELIGVVYVEPGALDDRMPSTRVSSK
jgi:hypothetical protein